MSEDYKDKKKMEDLIKENELKKVDVEIARIEEERRKLELERKELERKHHLHWYKKPLFLQAIIAGIIAVPLIWFYITDVALPISKRENIKLSKQLIEEKENLEEMKRKHKIEVAIYIEDLKKLRFTNQSLIKELEELNKDKYADKIRDLKVQQAEIDEKVIAVSNVIRQAAEMAIKVVP